MNEYGDKTESKDTETVENTDLALQEDLVLEDMEDEEFLMGSEFADDIFVAG